MPATINQNVGRYWWSVVIAFVLGAGAALYVSWPHMCDVEVRHNGKPTVCHGRPFMSPPSPPTHK